jgi:hypothetical protein
MKRVIELLEEIAGQAAQKTQPVKAVRTRTSGKLNAAVAYLRANPECAAWSSRRLAREVTAVQVSHVVWNKAKGMQDGRP